jgi:septum formation protein
MLSDVGDSPCPTLILASASPRRRELLATLALPFSVMPAHVDERHHAAEPPESYVVRLARTKAGQLAEQFPSAWVLGADTVVVLGQRILGKPADAAAARAMLSSLSGREHTVMTGVAVVHHGRRIMQCDVVSTRVRFHGLQAADIEAYIATREPFDKAGAYAVQGGGGQFVAALEGCYHNVVGLPLERTMALLRSAGYGTGA